MDRKLSGVIADEVARVADLRAVLDDGGHELDANEWLDAIEGETDFNEAIEMIAQAVFELDGQAAGCKAMIDRVSSRKSRLENSADTLRGIMLAAMDKADVKTIKRSFVTVSLKAKPPALAKIDEAEIPSRFFAPQPPKLDKKALKAALSDGEKVPGANLDNGGISLQVRFT